MFSETTRDRGGLSLAKLHVFMGEEYLGQGWTEGFISIHYLCPDCGSVWAHLVSDPCKQHVAQIRRCPEHKPQWPHDGTLFEEPRYYGLDLPRDALARDLIYLTNPQVA